MIIEVDLHKWQFHVVHSIASSDLCAASPQEPYNICKVFPPESFKMDGGFSIVLSIPQR